MPAASWLSQAKSCLHFCKRWKTDIGICHFSCNLIGKKSLNSVASVVCTEVYSCTAEIWSGSKRCVSGLDTSVLLFSWKDGGKGERWNWTGGYHKVKASPQDQLSFSHLQMYLRGDRIFDDFAWISYRQSPRLWEKSITILLHELMQCEESSSH